MYTHIQTHEQTNRPGFYRARERGREGERVRGRGLALSKGFGA